MPKTTPPAKKVSKTYLSLYMDETLKRELVDLARSKRCKPTPYMVEILEKHAAAAKRRAERRSQHVTVAAPAAQTTEGQAQ